MGTVYLVRDEAAGREAALKVLRDPTGDPKLLRRFMREAEVLAKVRHPGVVRIHTTGWLTEGPFLLMEHVEGESLGARQQARSPREAARLTREVADAVAALHRRGLLHRDLKPSNVMLRPDGRPILLDFGLAREVAGDAVTRTGELLGTPAYMAPEQLEGVSPARLGPPVDVYGLAGILFELLTGRAPYTGSQVEVVLAALQGAPPPPSSLAEGVPAALDAVFRRATALAPADRYPHAGALRDDLDRFLSGEPTEAEGLAAPRSGRRWPMAAAAAAGLVGAVLTWASAGQDPSAGTGPPVLEVTGVRVTQGAVRVQGRLHGDGPWAEVALGDARQRVDRGAPFELSQAVEPGARTLDLEATGPGGSGRTRRVDVSRAWPRWFGELSAEARPPSLPQGLEVGERRGEYRWRADGSTLVWVPPGAFTMGAARSGLLRSSALADRGARQVRTSRVAVRLTRGFFLGEREVTWAQWDAFCAGAGRPKVDRTLRRVPKRAADMELEWQDVEPFAPPDEHPAHGVPWTAAAAYCARFGLRLPTEAEWEWAARGGQDADFVWGSDTYGSGECSGLPWDGFRFTSPAGSFPRDRSPFGALDMAGNVGEWVADWFAPFPAEPQVDPRGPPAGQQRVVRGGSWADDLPDFFTVSYRLGRGPDRDDERVGFRVALSAD